MTAVKDAREPDAGWKACDANRVDLVVNNVACSLEIDRVDDLVLAVFFVAIKVSRLSAVSCTCWSVVALCTGPSGKRGKEPRVIPE